MPTVQAAGACQAQRAEYRGRKLNVRTEILRRLMTPAERLARPE